jgi:hypothetical protein
LPAPVLRETSQALRTDFPSPSPSPSRLVLSCLRRGVANAHAHPGQRFEKKPHGRGPLSPRDWEENQSAGQDVSVPGTAGGKVKPSQGYLLVPRPPVVAAKLCMIYLQVPGNQSPSPRAARLFPISRLAVPSFP